MRPAAACEGTPDRKSLGEPSPRYSSEDHPGSLAADHSARRGPCLCPILTLGVLNPARTMARSLRPPADPLEPGPGQRVSTPPPRPRGKRFRRWRPAPRRGVASDQQRERSLAFPSHCFAREARPWIAPIMRTNRALAILGKYLVDINQRGCGRSRTMARKWAGCRSGRTRTLEPGET